MQCPFLIELDRPYCETGSFGTLKPKPKEYRKYCTSRAYYQCRVYRVNTGNGDREKCLEYVSSRLVKA